MKIHWAGHAQFVIHTQGKVIVTDPPAPDYGYPPVEEKADIVTVSHEHGDHNAVETLVGNPQVIRSSGTTTVAGIHFTGFPCWHDPEKGALRGSNMIFKIESEGLSVVHLGDVGEQLTDEVLAQLGKVDVLMVPVGSVFTIDAEEAFALVQRMQPRLVLPMHYMTPFLSFTLEPLEKFTQKFAQVLYRPALEVDAKHLPDAPQVVVLTL